LTTFYLQHIFITTCHLIAGRFQPSGQQIEVTITTVQSLKVTQINQGKDTFNKLDEAGSHLQKRRVIPSGENLNQAHSHSDRPAARRGQIIDIVIWPLLQLLVKDY